MVMVSALVAETVETLAAVVVVAVPVLLGATVREIVGELVDRALHRQSPEPQFFMREVVEVVRTAWEASAVAVMPSSLLGV
jgi:hypothetical protein